MKYVFSTFVYLPVMGGIQVYIHQIATYLINHGNQVCIITSDENTNSIVHETIDGAHVLRLPVFEIAGFELLKKQRETLKAIDKEIMDADVVHVNAPKFLYRYFAIQKKKYKYRLVATSHGWFYHTKKYKLLKDLYFKHVVVRYSQFYDGIINVSYQDQDIAKEFGLKDTCVIENGVNIYKYANLPEKKEFTNRFIYFGRIAENKGIYECLKKMKTLREDFIFDIIGNCSDKQYKEKIDAYVIKEGLSKNIKFWGRLSEENIRNKLAESDIILMPSLHEGFGMALAECLLSNRPIIANDIPAFRRILTSVHAEAFLFNFESDESDINEKVKELLESEIRPENGEQYSEETMIKKTLSVYEQ